MKPQLKYLFEVEFTDGEIYKQTPKDLSTLDPSKSEYYDILQRVEKDKKVILRFSLVGDGNRVTVDLKRGIFYVNKLPVLLESEQLPGMPEKFELIFYRQWKQELDVTYKTMKVGPVKIISEKPKEPYCEYFIGWKCQVNGKSYQQKIAVQ